jgi:hypothetical protein
VAGRLLCDTYLCARDLVHEVDYTLTTLARNLLKQERAELNSSDIPGGYSTCSPASCVADTASALVMLMSKAALLTAATPCLAGWLPHGMHVLL